MAEISQLTLAEVDDLFEYWREHPPTHVLVAAYLLGGGKKRSTKQRVRGSANRFGELTQAVTAAGGCIHKGLPNIYRQGKVSTSH